jgi:nucleoid-associated protein YgaU
VQPKSEPTGSAPTLSETVAKETPSVAPPNETLIEEQPAAAAAEPSSEPPAVAAAQAQAQAPTVQVPVAADEPPPPEPSAMEESQGTDIAAAEAPPAGASTLQEPSATAATADAAGVAPAVVIPRKGQIVIQPGNSLWRISRVLYGRGIQYTVIYEANRTQIRNPDLIYPGQIFATPGAEPTGMIDPAKQAPLATTTSTPTSAE